MSISNLRPCQISTSWTKNGRLTKTSISPRTSRRYSWTTEVLAAHLTWWLITGINFKSIFEDYKFQNFRKVNARVYSLSFMKNFWRRLGILWRSRIGTVMSWWIIMLLRVWIQENEVKNRVIWGEIGNFWKKVGSWILSEILVYFLFLVFFSIFGDVVMLIACGSIHTTLIGFEQAGMRRSRFFTDFYFRRFSYFFYFPAKSSVSNSKSTTPKTTNSCQIPKATAQW